MSRRLGLRQQANPVTLIMRPRHEQLGDERGPSRLMRGADAAAGVAVKIFVKRNAILVIGIELQLRLMAQDRSIARAVLQENARQTMREFGGHLVEG